MLIRDAAERFSADRANFARAPWPVAELGDEVAGSAYAAPHRERAAYRWATEVTVYVAAPHRRRGVARTLYRTLFELLGRQGLRIALAGITLPNEPSV